MRLLALDTSTDFLSLACLEDGVVAGELHEEAGIRHSEILASRIKDILEDVDWDISDIGAVAAGVGPGSFTGLRIGVSTAKGLALVLNASVIGIPSLDAIAMRGPSGRGLIVPVLDAHKGKVYTCVYERMPAGRLKRKSGYLLCDVTKLEAYLGERSVIFGNGLDKYEKELGALPLAETEKDVDWFPRASDIGKMAFELMPGGVVAPEALEPMYLYASDCNILKK
jgi:tRNA threonylcarbamoyladenosine biosynthesis protein TsaB